MKIKSLLVVSLVLLLTAVKSNALYINFDSVPVNTDAGADPTAYLAPFGVTVVNNTNPGSVNIYSDQHYYGSGVVNASSPHNFLLQNVGGSPNGISFTLDFSNALSSLSFTRIAILAPSIVAQWTATAYAGSTPIGAVGQSLFFGTEAAQTYTLSGLGLGITSLTISANGFNFAGIPSAPLDDFTGTEVPESGSTFALLIASLLALFGASRLAPFRQRLPFITR